MQMKSGTMQAEVGVILGSGFGAGMAGFPIDETIDYSDVSGIPLPTVPGHGGKFLKLDIAGTKVLAACGRIHLYEGRSAKEATAIVRVMAEAGVKVLLLTNAAGSLHEDWKPGTFMGISDHLNLTGTSPLEGGPNFIDMTRAYDGELACALAGAANDVGISLQSGVYAAVRGPQYETAAEIRMLRTLGADAVGMSTVLEAIQARALGIRVAGLSLLTNLAAGVGSGNLNHEEVMAEGQAASGIFGRLFESWVKRLNTVHE